MGLVSAAMSAGLPRLTGHHSVVAPGEGNIEQRVLQVVDSAFDGASALRDEVALRVTEVRTNGRRVDARLAAPSGRQWLVVVWFADDLLDVVDSVTVYPRPEPFPGVERGMVIVLNGPSSVGKSSLMRAFAEQARTPFAYFDEPFMGTLPATFLAWPETLGPWEEGTLAALAAAAAVGNQFILSSAGIAHARFRAALASVECIYVGLHAPLEVLVHRQLAQVDKFGGLAEESVGIHEGWTYDLQIDTSRSTPAKAARVLSEYLEHRVARS
jgi:chloramphenicol 3-O phosphotransferase